MSARASGLSAERPFPGLRPFAFTDRAYFFGREDQIFALYRLVSRGRFVAVVGSSGSGKSSLFNQLAGADFSTVGVTRPVTRDAHACVWGVAGSGPLPWASTVNSSP